MSKKLMLLLIPALAAAAFLGACGGSSDSDLTGNEADAAFAADMVPHHEGAVLMANMALIRAEQPELKAMAKDMIAAQEKEIAQMESISGGLPEVEDGGTGEMTMGDEHMGHMGMDAEGMGMSMDPADLVSADSFDIAFIDMMIPHHEGAIEMARDLQQSGENPELQSMADDIITSQAAEIRQMKQWRTEWKQERFWQGGGQ